MARREVLGPGDGSEVWKNGVTGNGDERRPNAERCGTREFGAGAVAAKQQMYSRCCASVRAKESTSDKAGALWVTGLFTGISTEKNEKLVV